MRLLDTETGLFVDIVDARLASYAILSHVWDRNGEQTYQDLRAIQQSLVPTEGTTQILLWVLAAIWWRVLLATSILSSILRRSVDNGHLTNTVLFRMHDHTAKRFATQIGRASARMHATALDIHSRLTIFHGTKLSKKVKMACAIARAQGYRYIWIDSCCIDKTSSSELSEAINSMYAYYEVSAVCYAFLADVPTAEDPRAPESQFRKSRWWTRGWTLQELIAPQVVVFLSQEWQVLGSKSSLVTIVEEASGIERAVLRRLKPLSSISVARRMSWMVKRQTTRAEDQAYSLLGIFGINMPTLYGEGDGAFVRLQEEIWKRIPDQSLLAWGHIYTDPLPLIDTHDSLQSVQDTPQFSFLPEFYVRKSVFACTPSDFFASGSLSALSHEDFLRRLGLTNLALPEYTTSPHGIRTEVTLLEVEDIFPSQSLVRPTEPGKWYILPIACEDSRRAGHLLARVCLTRPSQANQHVLESGIMTITRGHQPSSNGLEVRYGLVTLSPSQMELCRSKIHAKRAYMPPPSTNLPIAFVLAPPPGPVDSMVTLASWAIATLRKQGYDIVITTVPPPSNLPNARCILIAKGGSNGVGIVYAYNAPPVNTLEVLVSVYGYTLHSVGSVVRTDAPGRQPTGLVTWQLFAPRVPFEQFRFKNAAGQEIMVRVSLERMFTTFTSGPPFILGVEVIDSDTDTPGPRVIAEGSFRVDYDLGLNVAPSVAVTANQASTSAETNSAS